MSHRVLVIEDHDDNRRIIMDALEHAGFAVQASRSAEDGLRLANADRPDLIILDIQLPGMDGYEATQQLKSSPTLGAVPIIVLTSNAFTQDEARAKRAGCDLYLAKPISPRRLLEHVSKLVGRQTQGASA